jgi:hypothetical protein
MLRKSSSGARALEVNAEAVLRLAHRSGCSPYGCESLQLAKDRETQLLTYDTPVLEAFPGVAMRLDEFVPGT